MLRNQATALLKYEHLTTTVPKAKELRPFVERLITVAKRGLAAGEANGRVLNARRLVMQDLQDREVVSKLFETIAPRFAARPGGYTRLMRTGYRKGDSAELAMVELIGSEFDPNAKTEQEKALDLAHILLFTYDRLRYIARTNGDFRRAVLETIREMDSQSQALTGRKLCDD